MLADAGNWDVVVTTYEMVKSMAGVLARTFWHYVVCGRATLVQSCIRSQCLGFCTGFEGYTF